MTSNQPDLIIKIDWKMLYWNMLLHNPYFNTQFKASRKMTCNQPDLNIKTNWKILYWNMLLYNPYFNKQLGKQENDIQFQHSTRAALLYHVSKKVPDQLFNWGNR